MHNAEMTLTVGAHVYIAAYNALVTIKAHEGDTVIIAGPTQFYSDAETNRLRTRVRRDILERMGYPVLKGVNVEDYELSPGHFVLRVKDVGVDRPTLSGRDDFWRRRDDEKNGNGLYRDAEALELAPKTHDDWWDRW